MIKKITTVAGSIAIGSVVALAPFAAFAQTGVSVTASDSVYPTHIVSTKGSPTDPTNPTGLGNPINGGKGTKAQGDAEITKRIASLNEFSQDLNSMKNLPASAKTTIQQTITTEISTLTSLKAKIDADTDPTTIGADIASITKDYRVYLLVLPQVRIEASVDAAASVSSSMQQLSVILQTRISEAQAAGKDMTAALAALADMKAKIADANTLSAAALAETANLTPDQGNATIKASNAVAVKDAVAKMNAVSADFKAARADITLIENAVKGTQVSPVASTTDATK